MQFRNQIVSCAALMWLWLSCASMVAADLDQKAALRSAQAHFVRVHIHLRQDGHDVPTGNPAQGDRSAHSMGYGESSYLATFLDEERPLPLGGVLIEPRLVAISDPMIQPRFIERITVGTAAGMVDATPVGIAHGPSVLMLELAGPLSGAQPLAIAPDAGEPKYATYYTFYEHDWLGAIGTIEPNRWLWEGKDELWGTGSPGSILLDAEGRVAGVLMDSTTNASVSLDPVDWPVMNLAALDALHDQISTNAEASLLRTLIHLRSPRGDSGSSYGMYRGYYGNDDSRETETEWNGLSVAIGPDRLLVLANFKPDITARIETIRVFDATGAPHEATFESTLANYGALIARVEGGTFESAAAVTGAPIAHADSLIMNAEVALHGEIRQQRVYRSWLSSLQVGWRGQLYPSLPASPGGFSRYGYGQSQSSTGLNFTYVMDGGLFCIPVERRRPVTEEESWGSGPVLTPITYVLDGLDDIDETNVPLSEEEEKRLAWLGVELQGLDRDLARANGVARETQDGTVGALITYIYEGSPAAEAGLELGDILVRLHIEGYPRPLDIQESGGMSGYAFPWEQLSDMPVEYFDRMWSPWPSAENTLNRSLTEVGFGTPFEAEIIQGGELKRVPMKVTQGPSHFEAAAQHKSESYGLTARDLTFEVRRYFQKTPDEPGVILSAIEPGEPAAIAGLRPYEIITHVDDEPVHSVEALETALTEADGELRLSVVRMQQKRIVKLRVR